MGNDACDACYRELESGDISLHRVIPEEVSAEVGILDTRTVTLCRKCYLDVQDWYRKRVSEFTYDFSLNKFRMRSPREMFEEYGAAYRAFVKYQRSKLF